LILDDLDEFSIQKELGLKRVLRTIVVSVLQCGKDRSSLPAIAASSEVVVYLSAASAMSNNMDLI